MGNQALFRKEKGELTFLPVIKKKYKPISLLGSGAFGLVLKVQDVKTKKLFALKSACRNKKKYGEPNLTCKNEKEILAHIGYHQNIVTYLDYFTMKKSPIEELERKKNQGPQKGLIYDNLIIEYCEGCDLSRLLEVQKDKIPFSITIKWFIQVLKAFQYIHHKCNVIHRDMKPDNILVCFKRKDSLDDMKLKISDFGSAKIISSSTDKKEGRRGQHMFYSSPEVVFDGKADIKSDIWALGLVFFQVVAQVSVKEFEAMIKKIFQKLMKNPKTKSELMKQFNLEKVGDATYMNLMYLVHQKNLIWDTIITKLVDDMCVITILKKMICDEKSRETTNVLLKNDIIKGWDIILNKEKRKYGKCNVLSVLSFYRRNEMVNECLDILCAYDDYAQFFIAGGLSALFKDINVEKLLTISKVLFKIISSSKRNLKRVCNFIVENFYIKVFRDAIVKEDSNRYLYLLIYGIVRTSGTIAKGFVRIINDLINKMVDFNFTYILAIVEWIVPFCKVKEFIKMMQDYSSENIFFVRKFNQVFRRLNFQFKYSETFLRRITSRVKEDINAQIDVKENLFILLYLMLNIQYLNEHKLEYSKKPSEYCRLNYLVVPEGMNVFMEYHERSTRFTCKGNEKAPVELISSESISICNANESIEEEALDEIPIDGTVEEEPLEEEEVKEEEKKKREKVKGFVPENAEEIKGKRCVIGYYELIIVDGGSTGDLSYGFHIVEGNLESKLFYDIKMGLISFYDAGDVTKVHYRKSVGKLRGFVNSGDVYGVGISKNGYVFFTKNNKILYDFKLSLYSNAKFRSIVKICGNEFLEGIYNFGKKKFCFNFKHYFDKQWYSKPNRKYIKTIVKIEDIEKCKNSSKGTEDEIHIQILCDKIISLYKNPKLNIIDDYLVKLNKSNGYFSTKINNLIKRLVTNKFKGADDMFQYHEDTEEGGMSFENMLENVKSKKSGKKKKKGMFSGFNSVSESY